MNEKHNHTNNFSHSSEECNVLCSCVVCVGSYSGHELGDFSFVALSILILELVPISQCEGRSTLRSE